MADIGVAALAITQGISSFTFFLPKINEVRKGSMSDPDFVADVRTGEVAGLVVTVGVGAICSSLTQSSVPAITSLVVALMIIALYEITMRSGSVPGPVVANVVGGSR